MTRASGRRVTRRRCRTTRRRRRTVALRTAESYTLVWMSTRRRRRRWKSRAEWKRCVYLSLSCQTGLLKSLQEPPEMGDCRARTAEGSSRVQCIRGLIYRHWYRPPRKPLVARQSRKTGCIRRSRHAPQAAHDGLRRSPSRGHGSQSRAFEGGHTRACRQPFRNA